MVHRDINFYRLCAKTSTVKADLKFHRRKCKYAAEFPGTDPGL